MFTLLLLVLQGLIYRIIRMYSCHSIHISFRAFKFQFLYVFTRFSWLNIQTPSYSFFKSSKESVGITPLGPDAQWEKFNETQVETWKSKRSHPTWLLERQAQAQVFPTYLARLGYGNEVLVCYTQDKRGWGIQGFQKRRSLCCPWPSCTKRSTGSTAETLFSLHTSFHLHNVLYFFIKETL